MKRPVTLINSILICVVIGMLIYIVIIGPYAFNAQIESIRGDYRVNLVAKDVSDSGSLDLTPTERCESEFNKYSLIGESKYEEIDYVFKLTKIINNNEEAKEFDDTYAGFLSGNLLGMDISTLKVIEYDYPIIALLGEIKVNRDSGKSVPLDIILYCSGSGVISEQSKKMLTLSN